MIVVPANLTGIRYRDKILDPVDVLFVRRHNLVFQQDNARPHTARLVTTFFLQRHNLDALPWPAFSPDMPVVHHWDILYRRVSSRVPPPNNIAQMQEDLGEKWEAIPQQGIRRLVHSMRRRLPALIQANGGHTRY